MNHRTPENEGGARESFDRSPYFSVKHTSYFQVYDHVLSRFRGRAPTFVEVGVLGGGSLFMWRDYLGSNARIIGVDANPNAAKWRDHGFEIFIGDQADKRFWRSFYEQVGMVDVVLDDGGHQNQQQIMTVLSSLPHINRDGLIVVEDTHASYLPGFGNPSRFSFMNWAHFVSTRIQSRFSGFKRPLDELSKRVFSVSFYESIVVLQICEDKCFKSEQCKNSGEYDMALDFGHSAQNRRSLAFNALLSRIGFDPWKLAKYFR